MTSAAVSHTLWKDPNENPILARGFWKKEDGSGWAKSVE